MVLGLQELPEVQIEAADGGGDVVGYAIIFITKSILKHRLETDLNEY